MSTLKNRTCVLLLLGSLLMSCSVSRKIEGELRKQEEGRGDLRGLVVYDLSGAREIINHNGAKYFIPASNVKLFTFYAAYKVLPDSVASLEYQVRGDSLFIRGTADPMVFESSREKVLGFLEESPEKIFLVDAHIEDEVYGPGWAWDDYASGFMPERSLFPVYGNRVRLRREGDRIEVDPDFFAESVEKVDLSANPEGANNGKRLREPFENRFSARSIGNGKEVEVPFITSNQLVADLLGDAIGKKVTLVKGTRDEDFMVLRTMPYDSLYARMLIDSDNFIAEQLLLRAAHATDSVYRVKTAIDHALDHLLPDLPQKPRWVDGSGLSRYNLFTPESMVHVLKKIHAEVPGDKLFGYFAVGGVSGTLEDSYAGPDGRPYVFAKSGTLSNNYCLSGFLRTKKGKLLIFSFMDNHYLGSSQPRKKELQALLERLRDAY